LVYDRGRMTPGLISPRSSWPSYLLAPAALWLAAGCTTDTVPEASVTHPTMIEISPDSLLGAVPCTEGSGLQRYVATLIDVTADDDETVAYDGDFALPSSPPTPCLSGVGFGFIVPGRQYRAQIDGYDTSVLSPRAPGSDEMVDVVPESPRDLDEARRQIAAANVVKPKWQTTCSATTAVYLTVVQAVCAPFDAKEDGTTELRLSVPQLLGELECGSEAGQIESFSVSVRLVGEDEPRVLEVACDAGSEIVLTDLPGKAAVQAFVSAFSAGSTEPLAGAECEGVTFQSSSVTGSCGELSQLGTLRVDLGQALQAAGLSCDASSVGDVQVLVPGEAKARSFPPPDCLRPFDFGFAGGAAAVTVTALDGNESELASLTCGGEVVPGSLVRADCTPNPAP
jgi:hypothetical protein